MRNSKNAMSANSDRNQQHLFAAWDQKETSVQESKPIWHRITAQEGQPGESARAYEAARLYFEMGSARSLLAVSQKYAKGVPKNTGNISLLKRWSARWNWVERAAAFDAHQAEERDAELQRRRAEEAQKWVDRDRELRERFFTVGEEIVEKAARMIQNFPEREITREEDKNGNINLTVRVKHSLSGLAQLMSIGAELQRLAVGIHPGSTPLDNLDLTKLSREDLIDLLEGRPIKITNASAQS